MRLGWLQTLVILLSMLALPVSASDCTDDCVPVGEWQFSVGLGLGWRNNPLNQGDDSPMFVLPEVSYYGKRFFVENLDFGFTLLETPKHQFNLLLTPSSEQMFFNPWDPYNFFDSGASSTTPSGASFAPPDQTFSVVVRNQSSSSVSGSPSTDESLVAAASSSSIAAEFSSSSVSFSSSSAPAVNQPDAPDAPSDTAEPEEPTEQPETSVPQTQLELGDISELQVNGNIVVFSADGSISRNPDNNNYTITVEQDAVALSDLNEGDTVTTAGQVNAQGEQEIVEYVYRSGTLEEVGRRVSAAPAAEASAAQSVSVKEVQDRKMAGLAGFEYYYSGEHFGFHTQALTDITNIHGGQELRFALILPLELERSRWALTLGTNYKSQKLLNYYYGVHPQDTASGTNLFEPDSAGLSKMIRLDWQKPLSKHWSLRGIVQYSWLPDPIHESPLVSDNYYSMFFFGGVYHF